VGLAEFLGWAADQLNIAVFILLVVLAALPIFVYKIGIGVTHRSNRESSIKEPCNDRKTAFYTSRHLSTGRIVRLLKDNCLSCFVKSDQKVSKTGIIKLRGFVIITLWLLPFRFYVKKCLSNTILSRGLKQTAID